MKFILLIVASLIFMQAKGQGANQTTKKVKLEVFTSPDSAVTVKSKIKTYFIKWSFNEGPLPVGGRMEVLKQIERILKANKIDCPPVRSQIAPNIWLCSNGKKIRTEDLKLKELLTAAWKENE